MQAGDRTAIAQILPEIWAQMTEVELEVAFADLFGKRLAAMPFDGRGRADRAGDGAAGPGF